MRATDGGDGAAGPDACVATSATGCTDGSTIVEHGLCPSVDPSLHVVPYGLLGGHVCWENPLPHGYTQQASCANAADDVWLFGSTTMTHWDGSAWSTTASPTEATINAALCRSATDVWAVGAMSSGQGVSLHWDGTAWTVRAMTSTWMTAIAASSDGTLWAVTEDSMTLANVLVRFDGSSWTPVDATRSGLRGLWFAPTGDLWSAGGGPGGCDYCELMNLRPPGSTWMTVEVSGPMPPVGGLEAISGTSTGDAWAVGDQGSGLHLVGSNWTAVQIPDSESLFYWSVWDDGTSAWAVGGTGLPEDTRTAIAHSTGSTWQVSRDLPGGIL